MVLYLLTYNNYSFLSSGTSRNGVFSREMFQCAFVTQRTTVNHGVPRRYTLRYSVVHCGSLCNQFPNEKAQFPYRKTPNGRLQNSIFHRRKSDVPNEKCPFPSGKSDFHTIHPLSP